MNGKQVALLLALLAAALMLSTAACAERAAEARLEEVLAESGVRPLPEVERELREILETWPDTDAAARARRELQWVQELQTAQKRGLWLAAVDAARRVASAVERYRLERGAYPRDAKDLVPRYLEELVQDPWGEPVLYRRSDHGYTVVSLGADGLPGGAGPERDVVIESGELRAGTAP